MNRDVTISLPEELASEAQAIGLLEPASMESLLRDEIRRRRVDDLFVAADRLAAVNLPPLSDAEVVSEVQLTRASRCQTNARRG